MKSNGYLVKKEKDMLKAELDKAAIGDRIISLKDTDRDCGDLHRYGKPPGGRCPAGIYYKNIDLKSIFF